MPSAPYPRTMQRGPFKGRSFGSHGEYVAALEEYKAANPDAYAPRDPDAKRKPRASAGGPVSKEMAQGLVSAVNIVLAMIPATREDTLEDYEQTALVLAIVDTAKTNKFFANIILKVCSVQTGSRLAITGASLIAVRLAKREIIPMPIGVAADLMLQNLTQEASAPLNLVHFPSANGAVEEMPEDAPVFSTVPDGT